MTGVAEAVGHGVGVRLVLAQEDTGRPGAGDHAPQRALRLTERDQGAQLRPQVERRSLQIVVQDGGELPRVARGQRRDQVVGRRRRPGVGHHVVEVAVDVRRGQAVPLGYDDPPPLAGIGDRLDELAAPGCRGRCRRAARRVRRCRAAPRAPSARRGGSAGPTARRARRVSRPRRPTRRPARPRPGWPSRPPDRPAARRRGGRPAGRRPGSRCCRPPPGPRPGRRRARRASPPASRHWVWRRPRRTARSPGRRCTARGSRRRGPRRPRGAG